MTDALDIVRREARHFHFFCGSGGGAIGFNRSHVRVGRIHGTMRCIGGVDVDPNAIRDFTRLVGVEGTVLDLFTHEQFRMYHARCPAELLKPKEKQKRCNVCNNTGEAPRGWREATAADIRRAAHGERPNVVFKSAPCQGNSGMISDGLAATPRYQALNALALRAIELTLEAWGDDPPELIILENVPRITQRSPELIADVKHALEMAGYVVHESYHDCGELGGLAQHRKRWLMVARFKAKVQPFLYEPPRQRVRGVGEVIGEMPLPNDPRGGPMHEVPKLKPITWERLALIPAGEDWRALAEMDLTRLRIVKWHGGVLGVTRWDEPVGTIKGKSGPTCGCYSGADPRVAQAAAAKRYNNVFRVHRWEDAAGAITTGHGPSSGGQAIADRRVPRMGLHSGKMEVVSMDAPVGAVTGADRVGSGLRSVADARIPAFTNLCRVEAFDAPAHTVTAAQTPTNGAGSVADERVACAESTAAPRRRKRSKRTAEDTWGGGRLGVVGMGQAAPTRTAESHPTNGPNAVADLRVQAQGDAYGVVDWSEPRGAVINERAPGQTAGSVADPRVSTSSFGGNGKLRVTRMDEPAGTVIGRPDTSVGAYAVAEDRIVLGLGDYQSLGVLPFDAPAKTVTAASSEPGSGTHSVQDVRVKCKDPDGDTYQTQGHYGVRAWTEPARTVTAAGQHDNGPHSVADERVAADGDQGDEEPDAWLISPKIRVIISLDNTWHRPFTPLENAALQGYDWRALAGDPLTGCMTEVRQHTGNSVPPPSAEAIGVEMLRTLIMAWTGQTFRLSASPIWVQPLAAALSLPGDGVLEITG